MIYYKTEEEIELIRESSLLVAKTHAEMAKLIQPGVTTLELDKIAESAQGLENLNIPVNNPGSTSIRDLTNQVIEEIRRRNRQEERR